MKTTRREFGKLLAGVAAILPFGAAALAQSTANSTLRKTPDIISKGEESPKSKLTPIQKFEIEMEKLRHRLPAGIDFMDVGGQRLFPLYAASGGLSSRTIFYLWRRIPRPHALPIEFNPYILYNATDKQIAFLAWDIVMEGVRDFKKWSREINIQGGDMGRDPRPRYPIIADGGTMPHTRV